MSQIDIRVEPGPMSREQPADLSTVPFSAVKSDHMLVAEYHDGRWHKATIKPFGPIPLSPSISGLHYGISVFEGLKAHRLPDERIALFRPRENARRMQRSGERLAMPPVPEQLFLDGLRALVRLDERWVPPHRQGALYIRPCQFSIDESLRVKRADRYLFVAFTFPFGTYFAAPVDVFVHERYPRAFPGGTGDIKPGGNYAPTLAADGDAHAAGCHTVLWLDSTNRRYIEECGVMNVFFVIDREVITPNLGGTILPGVTRDSTIRILRDMEVPVQERPIDVDEIVSAAERGILRECFGTGTAATVSHVRRIKYRDRDFELPSIEARAVGPEVQRRLSAIMTGDAPDTHGWLDII